MLIQPIDYFLVVWFALALASTAYVAWDQFRGNPEPAVMKWGFVLITLYMGPLGPLLYVLADKKPRPGTHETFVEPLWKQGVGSTIHCVAGGATGIIVAAVITAALGLPMWQDLIVETSRASRSGCSSSRRCSCARSWAEPISKTSAAASCPSSSA